MKKYIPVGLTIILFTLLNFSSYLVGLSHTPPGTIFTGAVHYPPDYYYYLSLVSQGAARWFTNYNMFSSESTIPELVGWFYTFTGHLLLPFFRSPIAIYQILTIGGSVLYLTAGYLLIKKLLPLHNRLQLLVFILFLTSSTMPEISLAGGHISYSYVSAYYNFGNPFERLANIPHHLLSEAALMIIFILTFDWWQKHGNSWFTLIVLALLGFIIAGIQPVWWLMATIVLGITGLIYLKKNIVYSLLPALIVGAAGLPFAVYLRYFWQLTPQQGTLWTITSLKPTMQSSKVIWDYIEQNGPLVVTALIGLPVWFRHMSREKFALTCMTALSLLLFFSPFPDQFNIFNTRFLSMFPTLFFATVTGFFLWRLYMLQTTLKPIVTVCAALLIGLAIPLDMQQLAERNYLFVQNNSWDYLSEDAIHAYEKAATLSSPKDTFLVIFPFDASFVGLTGRRIFISYAGVVNINVEQQRKLANAFIYNTMTENEKKSFLHKYHITYFLNWVSEPQPYQGVKVVYKNNTLVIYKVTAQE